MIIRTVIVAALACMAALYICSAAMRQGQHIRASIAPSCDAPITDAHTRAEVLRMLDCH